MGRISEKLVDEFSRQQPFAEDEAEPEIHQFADDLLEGAPTAEDFLKNGYDPLHVHYIMGHQFAAMFSEAVSEFEEFDEFVDMAIDVEDRYVPDADEMTPITGSFYSFWTLFDLRFGKDLETVGSCLVDVLKAMQAEPTMVQTMQSLADSRMGIYQHQGTDGPHIVLRELITGRVMRCHSSSGFPGQAGELWYVRLGPPLNADADYWATLTTPYVLSGASAQDWTAYLNKSLLGTSGRGPETLHELLKYGKHRTFWHDFIVQAFHHAEEFALFLEGLPDVPASMPNAGCLESLGKQPSPNDDDIDEEPVLVELTIAQRRILASILPETAETLDLRSKKNLPVLLLRKQVRRAAELAQEVCRTVKGAKRKPFDKLIEIAALDQLIVSGNAIFQIHVELDYTDPPVWRRILIEDCTLEELHLAIQAAMGWNNEHLFAFDMDGTPITTNQDEECLSMDQDDLDASEILLSDVVPLGLPGYMLDYIYDFGDSWEHSVTFEKIMPRDGTVRYPCCVAGARACPPEDCGGIYGFLDLLDWLNDPKDNDDPFCNPCDKDFDPSAFDAQAATRKMKRWLR